MKYTIYVNSIEREGFLTGRDNVYVIDAISVEEAKKQAKELFSKEFNFIGNIECRTSAEIDTE
ncbi:hypothetical protein FACS1894166_12280 [Bacilli bacterium]|nr:hypothetical protein FACS1894166_12280 [Bacilli bacterium]